MREMRRERLLQRVKVSIVQSRLYPPANDERDIIDTQQHDSLSTGGNIRAIQPTERVDVLQTSVRGKTLITDNTIRNGPVFHTKQNQLTKQAI